jgi:hypothetical protein
MDRWQEKAREVGPDFDNLEEYRRNQFLWQFDKPMRDKLDELADLPHSIRDIAATATRLRPNIAVGKPNPQTDSSHGKDKKPLSRKDHQLQQSNRDNTNPFGKEWCEYDHERPNCILYDYKGLQDIKPSTRKTSPW